MQISGNPLLYQVNLRVWLAQLSQELGKPTTLDDLPEAELEKIASLGFEWVYCLGVWQTGQAGRSLSRSNPEWLAEYRKVLPDLTEDDICGSPFAITAYTAHAAMGGNEALRRLHHRLNRCGLRLMLDFVPNHTAPDHPWVFERPEYYVPGVEADLIQQPQNYQFLQTNHGPKILARGRDPYFPGWPDTLQLNYSNPDLQYTMQAELVRIAGLCDGLRCDMAMLVLPAIFQRTWGISIEPFWPVAIQTVRQGFPGFTFMAEVYWDLEMTLLEQGFDYAYDKSLYDLLRGGDSALVRAHLEASRASQHSLVHFLENHDELRAAAVFPHDVHQAAAVIAYTSPSLRFFHQGQLEGYQTKISVHLCRGPQESPDPILHDFYMRLLACLRLDILRDGQWQLIQPQPAWEDNNSHTGFIATIWQGGSGARLLVVVNYAPSPGQCYLTLPFSGLAGELVRLEDLLGDAVYERQGDSLVSTGLYLDLPAWGYHVFNLTSVNDQKARWE
jgi:hypothetical protein